MWVKCNFLNFVRVSSKLIRIRHKLTIASHSKSLFRLFCNILSLHFYLHTSIHCFIYRNFTLQSLHFIPEALYIPFSEFNIFSYSYCHLILLHLLSVMFPYSCSFYSSFLFLLLFQLYCLFLFHPTTTTKFILVKFLPNFSFLIHLFPSYMPSQNSSISVASRLHDVKFFSSS